MAGRLLYGIQINHGFGCEEELFWDRIPDSFLDEIDTHTLHAYNASYNGGEPCGDTFWIYCAEVPEEHVAWLMEQVAVEPQETPTDEQWAYHEKHSTSNLSEDWFLNFWQGSGDLYGDPEHPLQAGCSHWDKEARDYYAAA